MAKIGIFWVWKGIVLGKARNQDEGEEGVPGIVDSPDSHVDLWPSITLNAYQFPALMNIAYEYVPRGRVLYDRDQGRSIVYLDKTLDRPNTRKTIAKFFDLDLANVTWESDPHYTTDPNRLGPVDDAP
jgi:hypothetical protein